MSFFSGLLGGGGRVGGKNSAARAEAQVALEKWNDYKTRFRPAEMKFLKMARQHEADYARNRGRANVSLMNAIGTGQGDAASADAVHAGGGSGMAALNSTKRAITNANALAGGTIAADAGTTNLHFAGLQKAAKLGGNISDSADLTRMSMNRNLQAQQLQKVQLSNAIDAQRSNMYAYLGAQGAMGAYNTWGKSPGLMDTAARYNTMPFSEQTKMLNDQDRLF